MKSGSERPLGGPPSNAVSNSNPKSPLPHKHRLGECAKGHFPGFLLSSLPRGRQDPAASSPEGALPAGKKGNRDTGTMGNPTLIPHRNLTVPSPQKPCQTGVEAAIFGAVRQQKTRNTMNDD